MSKRQPSLKQEVAPLVEKCVAEEAVAKVWGTFEAALEGLDPHSLEVFSRYLNGATPAVIAMERKIGEEEVGRWLAQIKRQVITGLRKSCEVRH